MNITSHATTKPQSDHMPIDTSIPPQINPSTLLLGQHVGIRGNTTDIVILLICTFLLTPSHHDDAELGVREDETLARHQAVVVYTR